MEVSRKVSGWPNPVYKRTSTCTCMYLHLLTPWIEYTLIVACLVRWFLAWEEAGHVNRQLWIPVMVNQRRGMHTGHKACALWRGQFVLRSQIGMSNYSSVYWTTCWLQNYTYCYTRTCISLENYASVVCLALPGCQWLRILSGFTEC